MDPRSRLLAIWLSLAILAAAIVGPLWNPMRVAWRCIALHQSGARERAQVMHKLERTTFALRIVDGAHAGQGCTAETSRAVFDAVQPGDELEVVFVEWKAGACELSSTIETSARLFWLLGAAVAGLLAGLLALGVFLTRCFTKPVRPARPLSADPAHVRCPVCGAAMDEGYLPLLAGIHWRRLDEPIGLPHALGGLTGTVGWRRRPRLHAFRCVPCEIVTFQHGEPPAR